EGALQLSVRLDRAWLDTRGGASYLEIGIVADGMPERGPRTAVNAVLVIDRSGSMSGEKIARARDAARALIAALDGEARLGIVDFASAAHLQVAARDFGRATVSTFGIGEDYDEDLLAALAAQGGGRTRFIHSASELEPALRAELTRAARTVARDVRLDVRGLSGARVVRVLGY